MGSYKKKLFIALLLILLIGFFVCGSVSANTYNYSVDQVDLIQQQQNLLSILALKKLEQYGTDTQKANFKYWISNANTFPLLTFVNTSSSSYISCYFLPININWSSYNTSLIDTTDEYFEDTYFEYPISGYSLAPSTIGREYFHRFTFGLSSNTVGESNYTNNVFIPSCLIYYQNQTLSNYISGITPSDNVYLMIMQSIQDNTEQEEETTNELKKLNDFMKSDDVDDDAYDMPGNSDNPTQDITQNGVNNIFDIFYNEINNWESQNITVRIPFTNKFFYIPANLTENIIDTNFPAGAFKNLLGLIWYYLLAVYIIKDVQKYIDGLQTGEILTKSDTNIKTEML